jgi:hypothetical protein
MSILKSYMSGVGFTAGLVAARCSRVLFFPLLYGIVLVLGWQPLDASQDTAPLTLAQIEALIDLKGMPDAALAGEIHDRHLTFVLSSQILEALTRRGAAPMTIEALRRYLPAPPLIKEFRADLESVAAGGSATITWSATGAQHLELLPDFGAVEATGQRVVRPIRTSQFTLNVEGPGGRASRSLWISVTDSLTGVGGTPLQAGTRALESPKPIVYPRGPDAISPALDSVIVSFYHRNHWCPGLLQMGERWISYEPDRIWRDDAECAGVESFKVSEEELSSVGKNTWIGAISNGFHIKKKDGISLNFGSDQSREKILSALRKALPHLK